jgi:hypothetical protein
MAPAAPIDDPATRVLRIAMQSACCEPHADEMQCDRCAHESARDWCFDAIRRFARMRMAVKKREAREQMIETRQRMQEASDAMQRDAAAS